MAKSYRIHPAIGIARVGNSPSGWFIGPEVPDELPDLTDTARCQPPDGKYKSNGISKRQAARFRVYEYDDASGMPKAVREITAAEADLQWTVHLANRKATGPKIFEKGDRNRGVAQGRLIIDAGPAGIAGAGHTSPVLQGSFQGTHSTPMPVPLGLLKTDAAGRLLVLGGFGQSSSPAGAAIQDTFNNDDWCDDTADGSVQVTLRFRDGTTINNVDGAWVLVGPPDYVPSVGSIISLYDVVYQAARDEFAVHYDPDLAAGNISFTRHVYPLLQRTVYHWWVTSTATGHAPGRRGDFLDAARFAALSANGAAQRPQRDAVFRKLRKPDGTGSNMPDLQAELDTGRRPRLTVTQYEIMEKWRDGIFRADWPAGIGPHDYKPPAFTSIPVAGQPFALDQAALGACVGASFYPGIEAPRVFREPAAEFPAGLYRSPFRIDAGVLPGAITRSLALPWQTDFQACGTQWWPAARPNNIFRNGSREEWDLGVGDYVDHWGDLKFVVPSAPPIRLVEEI